MKTQCAIAALALAASVTGQAPSYQRASQLPARIMDFKAEPASIKAGQPVNLVWSTENPAGVTLDPGIGRVTPRGSRQVSPSATTTYTLTVRGPNNQVLTKTVTVNVTGATATSTAANATTAPKEVPRTADGKPDLSALHGAAGGPAGAG